MSRAKAAFVSATPGGHKREIMKLMQQLGHRRDLWQVFSDFVEMAATSVANAVDHGPLRAGREANYMRIVKTYTPEEVAIFPKMMGHLAAALEIEPSDVLGSVFMELELGNKWRGQFFTPYDLCTAMAKMMLGDGFKQEIERKGFVTAMEPACGGGAMLIALAEEMRAAGVEPQKHLHVTAIDIDIKAVHMTYLQLSLLHIPAVVVHGNALAVEEHSHWYTPAHILGGWGRKLARGRNGSVLVAAPAAPEPVPTAPADLPAIVAAATTQQAAQGSLF